jgi:uncharacterized membrane protein
MLLHNNSRMSSHEHVGHQHAHGAIDLGPAGVRVRKILAAIVLPLILATALGLVVLWPSSERSTAGPTSAGGGLIAAKVLGVELRPCTYPVEGDDGLSLCHFVTISLPRNVSSSFELAQTSGIVMRKGDSIYVDKVTVDNPGGGATTLYSFYDFKRERPLVVLGLLFAVVALVIGRQRGLRSLIALVISMVVLATFMLPAIAQGASPLIVALVGASAVMFVALYLSHGINVRTTSAVIGTLASLTITGLLAAVAVSAARFTGLSDDSSAYLRATSDVDIRGILLAGVIIGALGVLDDVTITQSSAVWELHRANPKMPIGDLYRSAIRIGRDHIASAVNTLVLAYAGASLPILLLFSQNETPLGEVLNGEPVATEIVRMLAGSVGLMASVPITTALTALVVKTDLVPEPSTLRQR